MIMTMFPHDHCNIMARSWHGSHVFPTRVCMNHRDAYKLQIVQMAVETHFCKSYNSNSLHLCRISYNVYNTLSLKKLLWKNNSLRKCISVTSLKFHLQCSITRIDIISLWIKLHRTPKWKQTKNFQSRRRLKALHTCRRSSWCLE